MITPEHVRELLKAATPAPWRAGRHDLDHEDLILQGIPTRNLPLVLAAPEIAAAYLEAVEALRLVQDALAEIRTQIVKDTLNEGKTV